MQTITKNIEVFTYLKFSFLCNIHIFTFKNHLFILGMEGGDIIRPLQESVHHTGCDLL